MLSDDLVLLGEDLVLSGRLFVLTSDHKFLAGGRLSSLQRDLGQFLEAHSDRQEWLEDAVVEVKPVWLHVSFIDLSEHLEAFVKIQSVLGLGHDEPQRFTLLDGLLDEFHLLRNQAGDDAFVGGGNIEALSPIIIGEERCRLEIAELRADQEARECLEKHLEDHGGGGPAPGVRKSEDQRRLRSLEVFFVKVEDLPQVHRFKLIAQDLVINCQQDDLRGYKHVEILLVIAGIVKDDMRQVDTILILRGLPLDLVNGVEGEGYFVLREALAEAGKKTL